MEGGGHIIRGSYDEGRSRAKVHSRTQLGGFSKSCSSHERVPSLLIASSRGFYLFNRSQWFTFTFWPIVLWCIQPPTCSQTCKLLNCDKNFVSINYFEAQFDLHNISLEGYANKIPMWKTLEFWRRFVSGLREVVRWLPVLPAQWQLMIADQGYDQSALSCTCGVTYVYQHG